MTARTGGPVVELAAVSVRRGNRTVLRDVSCSVPSGTVVGLIGPSGCGKTTLMRTIVGVQANVAGGVTVLGRRAGVASRLGQVGYMTQDPSVYGDLSVIENLTYFAKLLGISADRVRDVLGSVRLDDMANSLVAQLSGGQRARVSLAVAMLAQPPLLVLDEPTVGLDPELRGDLWQLFSSLAAGGATLLVSSHVMDEAGRCDVLLLMRDGHILATGTPAELMARTRAPSVESAFLTLIGGTEES